MSIEICETCSNYGSHSAYDAVSYIRQDTTPEDFDKHRQKYWPEYELVDGGRCGWNVMGQAAYTGNVELVEHLYKLEGARLVNLGNEFGMTPLYCAVIGGQLATATKLIELGAKVNLATRSSCSDSWFGDTASCSTPLWKALNIKTHVIPEMVKLLLKHGGIVSPSLGEVQSKLLAEIQANPL